MRKSSLIATSPERKALTTPISSSGALAARSSLDSRRRFSSMVPAPAMAGMPSKKPKRAAASRRNPRRSPPLIVAPERLMPGISARACARPTMRPSITPTLCSGRSRVLTRSANQRSSAPAVTAPATTSGVRTALSSRSPAVRPRRTAGIVPITIARMRRSSDDSPRWRPPDVIVRSATRVSRITSLRSATSTAARVPR